MTVEDQAWRVLLVDDHPLMRNGLRAALLMSLPKAIVEEAGSAGEATEKFAIHRPQLVLLDVNLPGANGLDLARQFRSSNKQIKILMVAAEADAWTVRKALDAGACGFVAKSKSVLFLSQAVLEVLSGREFLCEDARAALQRAEKSSIPARELPGPAVLSQREREVLRCLAQGENTKSIADLLQISPKTVETHRQHIMRKLGINNVAALARYAIRHSLITV